MCALQRCSQFQDMLCSILCSAQAIAGGACALSTGKEPLKGAIYAEDCRPSFWVHLHYQILLWLHSFNLLLITLNLHVDFWHCRLAFFLHECRLALVASWRWKQGELWHPERPLLIHLKDLVSHICTQPCLQSHVSDAYLQKSVSSGHMLCND